MKFINVNDLRGESGQVWNELPLEQEMIITSQGRPIAILSAVDESNLEESLAAFRRARAAKTVSDLQRRSVEQGTDRISMDEIQAEIQSVRTNRSR